MKRVPSLPFATLPMPSLAALALISAAATAQEAEDPAAEMTDEITVTAQRIEESLQDVPISVIAVSGEELERQAILDVQALAEAAPGVVVSNQSSSTGEVSLVIRGIGSNTFGLGTESTVGYYIDGAYLPRPQGFVNPFLDLERVEILRGPQGTLWGRNSTGGAINLVTRAPEGQFKGRLFASASDYAAHGSASGRRYGLSLTGPLTEKVWARASGSATTIEDATWNDHLGQRSDANDGLSFRTGLTFLPSDTLTFTLRADRTDDDSHGAFHLKPGDVSQYSLVGTLSRFYGFENPLDAHRIAANIAPLNPYEENGYSLHVDKVLGGGTANLTSISSWRDFASSRRADVDAMPLDFVENVGAYESEWWSQEFQVSGDRDRARWIAGLYAFGEEGQAGTDTLTDPALFGVWLFANNPAIFLFNPADFCSLGIFAPPTLCGPAYYGALAPFLGLPLPGTVSSGNVFDTVLDSSSWAGYGQVDWRLGERTTLTTGLRYTSDTKEHSQTTIDFVTLQPTTLALEDSWNALTPKLGLEFRPRDGVMVYGAVTTGYKSGGFNSISLQPSFDEEKITSFEVGVKSRSAGGVTVNASAFSYDYDDLQVAVLFPDRSTVENAASARILGLDVELLVRPNPPLRVRPLPGDPGRRVPRVHLPEPDPRRIASRPVPGGRHSGRADPAGSWPADRADRPVRQGASPRARLLRRGLDPLRLRPGLRRFLARPRRVPVHGRPRLRPLRELRPAGARPAARPVTLDAADRPAVRCPLWTQPRRRGVPADRVLHHLHRLPAGLGAAPRGRLATRLRLLGGEQTGSTGPDRCRNQWTSPRTGRAQHGPGPCVSGAYLK